MIFTNRKSAFFVKTLFFGLVLKWSYMKRLLAINLFCRNCGKNFQLVSFYPGEKLCLKFCTVINKVMENRFLR